MVSPSTTQFNREKLSELTLFMAHKSLDDPTFGATKLNKLLFFSDFWAYLTLGKSITGATYVRREHGPVPSELSEIQQDLQRNREAKIVERDYFGYSQRCLTPEREPNISLFTPDELGVIHHILLSLRSSDAGNVSELSHSFLGWQLAGDREEIPYESVFLSDEAPTDEDIERAYTLGIKYGWFNEADDYRPHHCI